jgi:hypothetical protein
MRLAGAAQATANAANPAVAPIITSRRRSTFEVGNALEKAVKAVDMEKAVDAARLGDLKWLGDMNLIPPRDRLTATQLPPDEPWWPSHNIAHLEAMLAAKLMAALLIASEGQGDARLSNVIVDWRDIAGERASEIAMSAIDTTRAAFILLERSIGRSARTVRDKKRHATFDFGASEVQICTSAGEGGKAKVTDWFTFARKEELEADEAALREMADTGPPSTLPRSIAEDPAFSAGVAVTQRSFGLKDIAAAWKALDAADTATREELRKEHADDVKRAKKVEKKRADTTMITSVCREVSRQLRGASAANGSSVSRATSVPTTPSRKRSRDDDTNPGQGKSDSKRGPARTPDDNQKAAARNLVMAKPAADRTPADCARFGLCRRCKEPGHLAAACTITGPG